MTMQNSNFVYLDHLNTYLHKKSIVYLQVIEHVDQSRKAKLCLGNGATNYTLEFATLEEAETRRLEILNELV